LSVQRSASEFHVELLRIGGAGVTYSRPGRWNRQPPAGAFVPLPPMTGRGERTEISIAPSCAASMAALKAEACRSQALYLFLSGSNFLFELGWSSRFLAHRRGAACRALADGKLIYFSHHNHLCAAPAGSAFLGAALSTRRNHARAWASGCFLHDLEPLGPQFEHYDLGQMRAFLRLNPVRASPIRVVFFWITHKG
jgi:hypothetical protein